MADFTTIFKGGIILENILRQTSIILKNITKLSIAVLERFNDLLNYNPKIIINEDYCGTYTGNNKELTDFSDSFRIIGICSLESFNNLSEAAKNRFTILYTNEYNDIEKNIISKLYLPKLPTKFEQFITRYKKTIKKEVPFPNIFKILNFLKIIIDNKDKLNVEKYLVLSIYKSLNHFMRTKEDKNRFKSLINKFFESSKNYDFLKSEQKNKSPFSFKDTKLFSNRTNLYIDSNNLKENNSNIAFVEPFNELIDCIHTCIATHFPLIIEGSSGKGKKTAIEYIKEILGYEIVYIPISSSTTVDNLFCKINPIHNGKELTFELIESDLLKSIKTGASERKIIVIENLEQASSNILDALIPVFEFSRDKILLPTGDYENKGTFNLIATFDPTTKGNSIINCLPLSIQNSSIIFNLNEYSKYDIEQISLKMLDEKENNIELKHFLKDLVLITYFARKNLFKEIFTLNDIKKFDKFRKESNNTFDYNILAKILLINRFALKDEMDKATQELKYNFHDFWPEFTYILEDEILFSISALDSDSEISIPANINKEKMELLENSIFSLTPVQRIGLIFMLLSVNSEIPCILQGPKESGKSFLVKHFAKLIGKNLKVIELTNDSGISILTGQIIPNSEISNNDINEIKELFN